MKYGISLPNGWTMSLVGIKDPIEAYETMTNVAKAADETGFEAVWMVDHFHTVPTPTQEVTFESWMSLAAIARDTKRVRIGQIVTCNSYRNPALLAKMASTLDVLSHGRLNFGIGAGWYEHEYKAYGYPYPDAPERLRMLREALQVIHAMWEQEEAHFEGKFYQVRGAINQPKGVQKPHPPILVGGGGEKVTLKLVAQYGDACNVGGELATIKHKLGVLKQHCETVGRDYSSIYNTTGSFCSIADTDEEALALVPEKSRGNLRDTSLVGSPETIRQRIAALEELGIHEIIIDFPSATDLTTLHRFAQEFIAK
ncbi:LLM class F420-dependent oxidoreductase [Ktedonobacter racemifer]|uniref:Putative F420-dependent oxidoreductase n=1 Tax=Ktedonobacter racemifer DSM 44963 TaxID=485913 RepID=D6TYD9_KTERA|nr:LLM class F420-dependent oxidoreductase [Ktedonobacter racemifer]EFH83219.1 putative F420-dependent oxidoreductase [Ktedonobacter racemifer DSM 44963]